MKKKTIFKRIIALLCSVVCLTTSFVFPASASANDISIDVSSFEVSYGINTGFWTPQKEPDFASPGNVFNTISSYVDNNLTISSIGKNTYSFVVSDKFAENIQYYSTEEHSWGAFLFDVTPNIDVSNLNLSNYDLKIYYEYNINPNIENLGLVLREFNSFTYNLGLNASDILSVGGEIPRIDGFCGDDLISKGTKGSFSVENNEFYSDTFTFTDTVDIRSILDGSFVFGLPWNEYCCGCEFEVTMDIDLVYTGSGNTDIPDVPDVPITPGTGDFSFSSPDLYDYDTEYYFRPILGKITDGYNVTDFYSVNGSLRLKDTSDYIFMSSLPFDTYDMFLGFTYEDGYSDSDFSDTLFRTFSATIPTQLDSDLNFLNADFSKYGFRLDFYISVGTGSSFNFNSYKQYIDSANTLFYGYEPFSLQVGSVHIPYSCWNIEFNKSNNCIRARLELDGKNATHRDYMRALATLTNDCTFTFTLGGNLTSNNFALATVTNGFWIKYEDEGVVENPGDTPVAPPVSPDDDTPSTDSGITKEELDAAFNKGYIQGIADGSDKNYVFGFVNGLFSGLGNFYSILANGISIGGITLGSIITSIIIIVVLVIIIKKVT